MPYRLLILTDAPTSPLFCPRMRYLISNLSKQGWQCTVVSETDPSNDFVFPDCRHIQMRYYSGHNRLRDRLRWFNDKLFAQKEKQLYRLVTGTLSEQQFDLLLCSTFNTFPLETAARISRERHIPLVTDLRDIAEQWGETRYWQHRLPQRLARIYNRREIAKRNNALRHADAVTTVSPWHRQFLCNIHPNVHLIYNGFDDTGFYPDNIRTDNFEILYTGKIYDFGLRNPELLFKALGNMHDEGRLPANLILRFYCEENIHDAVVNMAEQYHVRHLLQLGSFVPNSQIPQLLHSASICLLLTNKAEDAGTHGIMTTKFFEALGVEKPVLCVRSDEECLAQVIEDTNAGLAATTAEQVEQFILDKYAEWETNGFTRQQVNKHTKALFSRQKQAQQFEELFADICEKTNARYTIVDICWTLFSSNTTFDFLDSLLSGNASYQRLRRIFRTRIGKTFNLLVYRLLHYDIQRHLAVRYLRGKSRQQLQEKAEIFYQQYLLPRKIDKIWQRLPEENIIIASGTLDVIAHTVARHIGAKQVYASELIYKDDICSGKLHDILLNKHTLTPNIKNYDIFTDNLSDISLVSRAQNAVILTYNNTKRWQKRLSREQRNKTKHATPVITYLDADTDRY